MAHRNARLTVAWPRLLLVQRVLAGRPVAHVVAELGVSRATGYKWLAPLPRRRPRPGWPTAPAARTAARPAPTRGSRRGGRAAPRPQARARPGSPRWSGCRPRRCTRCWPATACPGWPGWTAPPARWSAATNATGPASWSTSTSRSSAGSATAAAGGSTAATASSTARARRAPGSASTTCTAAIDDHTRLAYAEIHPDERAATCAGFLRRAAAWFAAHGIDRIERVMTDNAMAYRRSHAWREALAEIGAQPRFTRRYRPQTNGKAERFNRTLLDEWAYSGPSPSNERAAALPTGYTPTTITAPTPRSAANHPSAASPSTTSRGTTPSRSAGRPLRPLEAPPSGVLAAGFYQFPLW